MATDLFLSLSNRALLDETVRLAGDERASTACLLAALAEVDSRQLYLAEGFSCMFLYCTRGLHLSESAAYRRIEVARVSRVFPQVLDALSRGALNLTTAVIIAPHLTIENVAELIAAVSFQGRREAEQVIAARHPQPDVATIIRKERVLAAKNDCEVKGLAFSPEAAADASQLPATLPALAPPPAASSAAGAQVWPRGTIAPLSAARYKIQFTTDKETHDMLRYAQALLRHQVPNGDVASIFKRALTLLISQVEKKKLGIVARPRRTARPPRPGSRTIPASVRRVVSARDQGQCAFVGTHGRCPERGFLEFHHILPFAMGGAATPDNIALRCRAHNGHEWAERATTM